jgi:hypothetical protein
VNKELRGTQESAKEKEERLKSELKTFAEGTKKGSPIFLAIYDSWWSINAEVNMLNAQGELANGPTNDEKKIDLIVTTWAKREIDEAITQQYSSIQGYNNGYSRLTEVINELKTVYWQEYRPEENMDVYIFRRKSFYQWRRICLNF